jgi:hypothetical protein
MTRFVVGDDRSQSTLFPERLDADHASINLRRFSSASLRRYTCSALSPMTCDSGLPHLLDVSRPRHLASKLSGSWPD